MAYEGPMEAMLHALLGHFTLPVTWSVAAIVAIVVVLLGELSYRLMFTGLARLAGLTRTTLDDVLLRRMRLPARVLVFLFGFHVLFALRQIHNAGLSMAVTVTELLLVAYIVIEATETMLLHWWLGERHGVQVPNIVRHLLLVVVYTAAVLFIVGSVTGVNIAPVIATSTVVTVVIGLALQDTLGNLFAGLAMSMDRPFKIGDWIMVDTLEGCVVHIGWRSTHLQTFTKDIVVIPNSVLGRTRVQNFYAPTKIHGRNQEIVVALHAMPEEVEQAVQVAVAKVANILRDPAHKVWFVQTTPLFHRYVIRLYIDDFSHHDDDESDFMKVLCRELAARRINIGATVASPGVDLEGRPAVLTTSRPDNAGIAGPGGRSTVVDTP
jgi:small-conductance mechanosensitive channel